MEMKNMGFFENNLDKNGLYIKHIEYPTVQQCMSVVKQNGLSLQYVKNKSDKICIEAIKQNGAA